MEHIALPVNLEEWESNRAELEELDVPVPTLLLPTLADAQRAAARVAALNKKAEELGAVYDAEEEAILSALETLRLRKVEALKPYERRKGWYLFALEEFHRARLEADPKEKTIKLPSGNLSMRAQQPEWIYGDEEALAHHLLSHQYAAFVKAKYAVDKTALKKGVEVTPEGAVILKDTGEVLPGVTVQERPAKFEFKPA